MLKINNHKIERGQNKVIQIPIYRLPSGTPISLDVHVFNGKQEGAVVLLAGGLHGDEINGVEIIRKAIEIGLFTTLKIGAVIAVPLINVPGFINLNREASGKDVNRSFPGSTKGSLASLIAHTITHQILPIIDFGIDFHTGGASIYNYPQIRITEEDEKALELAKQTNIPIIIKKKTIPRSHRKQAFSQGKPMLVFEGGESLRLDPLSIQAGINAITNLLSKHQMIPQTKDKEHFDTNIYLGSKWQRSSKSGIFTPLKKAGELVNKGTIIGEINHLVPFSKTIIKAKYTGQIIGHRNNPVVNKGDALFHIAIGTI